MKKRSKLMQGLFLILFWALGLNVYAQSLMVTGTVKDASDGSSLPGVTILVKNTSTGTTSDFDGKYSLSVAKGSVLVFSFIGYEAVETVVADATTINISLKPATTNLDEIVVIGYGQVRKGDATGAVTSVSVKDFNSGSITNPLELMTGKTAGVQITNNSGAPGSGATIRIRGGSSLSASNDPLYVIDGIPVDNDGISGTRNAMSTINPNDIETFTILKDASATAIYGARASNGVIIITTKKGSATNNSKKPFKLEYTGNFSLYTIPQKREVFNGDEFRSIIFDRFAGKENVVGMLGTESTDWQSEIFRNSFGMDHNVSISGAYKTLPYRLSIGYSAHDGILNTDNMKRTNIGLTLNPTLFDDHLKVNLSAKGMFITQRFANEGAIGSAIQMNPTQPVFNADGTYYSLLQADSTPVNQATKNPVALIEQREDNSKVNRFLGNAQFDYKFHFLPELHANLNLGYDYSSTDGDVFVPGDAQFAFDALNGGGLNVVYDQMKKNELLDFTLNYSKEIPSIKSKLDLMGGYSWQHFYRKGTSYSTNDLSSPLFVTKKVNDSSDYATEMYLVSFFTRINYTLSNRYIVTFTLRDDGSSRFSPETRWGLFPSAAFAWRIHDEAWMKSMDNLSDLKLRLGWGITGQQNITNNDYPYMPRYTYGMPNAAYQFGDTFYSTLRPEGYDANIKWEETTTLNLGIDFGFYRDRVFGSFELYSRETKDLINYIPIPAGTNLSNYLLTNVGDLTNKGFEFTINVKPIIKKDLEWEIGFNATYNKNKITKLTATDDPSYLGVFTGGISGGVGSTVQIHSVGFPAYSFFVFEQVYDENGKPIEGLYVDRNDDGLITDDDRYRYKDAAADYFFGISSRVTYKAFDFAFSGRANFGNYVYDNFSSNNATYERLYRPEGPYLSNVATNVGEAGFEVPQYLSDYYIQDASFFKMDYMTLGYTLQNLAKGNLDLRLTATVNNAFTITKYNGIDPELFNGIDNLIYPRTRVFVLGVNLIF